VIGAGSVVTRDITVPGTYAGNPARQLTMWK
jgi:acetyltransferase-like isoleucine patch superfamily enzyme